MKSIFKNLNFIIAGLFYSSFLLAATFTLANPVLIEIGRSLNESSVTTGYIFTFLSLGFMSGAILSGFACKKWQRGRVLGIAFFLQVIGFAAFGLSRNLYIAYSLFLVLGIAAGIINVQINGIIGELSRKNSGLLFNLLHMFFGLGALIAPIISSVAIRSGLGWQFSFFIVSFFCLVNLIGFLFIKIPDADDYKAKNYCTLEDLNTSEEIYCKSPSAVFDSGSRFDISVFSLLAVAMIFSTAAQNGLSFWMPTYLREVRSVSEVVSGWSLSLFWGMLAIGRLLAGILSRRVRLEFIIMISGFGAFCSALLAVSTGNPLTYITLFGLSGLFTAVFFPGIISLGSTYYPGVRNNVITALVALGGIGTILGSFLANVIYRFSDLGIAMLTVSSFSIICFICMAAIIMVQKLKRRDGY
jgi:MFS family permease